MTWRRALLTAATIATPTAAQRPLTVVMGTPVHLVTAQPLSSKINVKGEIIALRTAEDVMVDGLVAIPRGTPATGQISDARKKGAMGMGGRLRLRPLYLRVGERTVRLAGAEDENGGVQAGAVIGMVLVAPLFTGKSAVIPEGAPVSAFVAKTVLVLQTALE